jgi:hypothetical protein
MLETWTGVYFLFLPPDLSPFFYALSNIVTSVVIQGDIFCRKIFAWLIKAMLY